MSEQESEMRQPHAINIESSDSSHSKVEINKDRSLSQESIAKMKLLKPRLYSYRWIILVLYLLGDLVPSIIVTTTTPIASQISQIYALQPIEVNLSSLVILIAAPIGTLFSSKFLDERGLSVSIRIGTIICTGGAWVRVLVNQSFYFVVIGNFLTGLGAPFIFNGKTQIASNWFSHQQGPGVTSFISFWANLNAIAGFVFAGNFLGDYRFDIDQANEGRNLVWQLMILIAFGVSGITFLIWIFFRQNPPTPPSFTAQMEREHDFKESVKKLIRNKNYIFLVFQQGLFLGSMSGLATSISYFIQPFGFDSSDSTLMLGAIPVGGVIGTIVGSYFLNKYKQYKYQMGIYSLGGAGSLFFLLLMLYTQKIYLVVISTGVLGIFFLPMIPTLLEFACESVFPIGEGSTVGFLSGMSSLFALIYGSIMSFIVKGESQTQTCVGTIIMLGSFGLGFLLLFLTKENLMRNEVERMSSSQFENSIQLSTIPSLSPSEQSSANQNKLINLQANTSTINTDIEMPSLTSEKESENIRKEVGISAKHPSEIAASDIESPSVFSSTASSDYSTNESKKDAITNSSDINKNTFLSTDSSTSSKSNSRSQTIAQQEDNANNPRLNQNSHEISDSQKIKIMIQSIYSPPSEQSKQNVNTSKNQERKHSKLQAQSSSSSDSEEEEDYQNSLMLNSLTDVDVLQKQLVEEKESPIKLQKHTQNVYNQSNSNINHNNSNNTNDNINNLRNKNSNNNNSDGSEDDSPQYIRHKHKDNTASPK